MKHYEHIAPGIELVFNLGTRDTATLLRDPELPSQPSISDIRNALLRGDERDAKARAQQSEEVTP